MSRSLKCKPLSLWILLGAQFVCIPAMQAQDAYVYTNNRIIHQQTDTNKKQEEARKQTLFKVLKELNKTKGVFFLFSDQALADKMVNPVKKDNVDIEKILDQVLENTGLRYKKVNEKTFVILAPKETSKNDDQTAPATFAAAESPDAAAQQADIITGKVTDTSGIPVVGASVTVKGTRKGTTTNSSGSFAIEAARGEIIVISAIGYASREIVAGDQTTLTVTLEVTTGQMAEVVVTALGINRRSKSITYATQRISGDELTSVKDPNLVNSLNGKVAGLTVNRSASGAGGSVKVVMRGNKSTQNNSPLYVIDGIPMYNTQLGQPVNPFGESSGSGSPGRDGGDAISNINPEDIESMQVLKGASAAALYGSQAANGAILITTRKGRVGTARIQISSSLTIDQVLVKPEAQFKYGQSSNTDGSVNEDGWGPENGKGDYTKDFFRTGVTWINGISMQAGSEKAQTYFSYSNTTNKNVIPTSEFNRHTFTFRETAKFFDDKLSVDGLVTLTSQKSTNRPVSGFYNNPQIGLYFLPRNLDFNTYKNQYEIYSPERLLNVHNWWNVKYDDDRFGNEYSQNPYWILNRNQRKDNRDRAFSSLSLKYSINSYLSVQARGNIDVAVDGYDSRMYASTHGTLADFNGRYSWENSKDKVMYGDVLLLYNQQVTNNISISGTLGASINDAKVTDRTFIDSYRATNPYGAVRGLAIANVFSTQNILSTNSTRQQSVVRSQTQSVLGSASIGYKDMLFLDLTARNDWSSALAFTPNLSFLYYSAGATAVLNEVFHLPAAIDLAKLRVSYAKVGNSVRAFATNPPLYTSNPATGAMVKNPQAPFPGRYLKPEDNRSFEVGTEWRFLKNRIGIDVTYYKNDNYDQYFETPAPPASGFLVYSLNLGHIRNTGVEVMLNAVPVKSKDFEWNTAVNFAANKNDVVKLSEDGVTSGTPQFALTAFDNTYGSVVREGGSFGDIISFIPLRNDKGQLLLKDADDGKIGVPAPGPTREVVGNPNPDFTAGWSNGVRYKRFEVSFLIDGRFGGEVMSLTQAELDLRGFSEAAAGARDAGGVRVQGVWKGQPYDKVIDARQYYAAIGGRSGIGEYYMYDATAIRLRELSLGYSVPVKIKGIRSLDVSLIGRNLFFIRRDAPFDPEVAMSTGNGLSGLDAFGLPSTRSFGLNLKVGF